MKNGKFILIAALVIAASFISSPSKNTAKPNHSTNVSYAEKSSFKKIDEKMLIYPKFNCDPKMLISCNPNIDPGFVLKSLP